jgi:hypothetical protein
MVVSKVRFRGLMIVGMVFLGGGSFARGERLPLPAGLQAKVNRAVDHGVVYLFGTQPVWGSWTLDFKNHSVGYAALPGLTLLECGESKDHLVIQRAVSFVRQNCAKLTTTYDLALAILFLDRLSDPGDEKLIQTLALRLIAGQTVTGGWSYRCPVLSAGQNQQLLAALAPRPGNLFAVPVSMQTLPVFHPLSRVLLGDPPNRSHEIHGTTDNSNTQFAALALWAARRHGVPMERTLALIRHRFNASQNRDGSWGYHYLYGGGELERPTMTCVGLLGLAIGHGLAVEQDARNNPIFRIDRAQAAAVLAFQPRVAFLLFALDQAERNLARDRARKGPNDLRVLNGFVALNKHLGEPVGRDEDIPQTNLYFLWSVERVAVLYNLATIGTKDWYRWGAEMLVANQQANGNWANGGYPSANPVLDTCLALLFLKRANLVADLTTRLPFDPEALTSSIKQRVVPPPDPSQLDSSKQRILKVAETLPAKAPDPGPAAGSKRASEPKVASLPEAESSLQAEAMETGSGKSWLWVFVLIALILFITSGILLASYSVSRAKPEKRSWRTRQGKSSPRVRHRSGKE